MHGGYEKDENMIHTHERTEIKKLHDRLMGFKDEPKFHEYGFGRAHHRVLHFVNRHPGMRVADLLEILKITKQSLGRVLKQLIDDGFVAQQAGKTDRRERRLYPTPKGHELADRLAAPQLKRISAALAASGAQEQACIEKFLREMISEEDRAQVMKLMSGGLLDPTAAELKKLRLREKE